jgi:glycine reductase
MRVIHFLNQFFGGIGAEEHANMAPEVREGPIGPGRLLENALKGEGGKVVATIICGDNYIVEEKDDALEIVREALDKYEPDVLVAGPAFDAGRYGLGCAYACIAAQDRGIPAVTGMHVDNTGIITHRRDIVAVPTSTEASGMVGAVAEMARLAMKLARGEQLGTATSDGYVPTGVRKEVLHDLPGSQRAFDMMMARVTGQPYASEVQIQGYDSVPPAPPITDMSNATLALVTSGGLVPKGNPDGQVGGRAKDFFRYSIDGAERLSPSDWESVHMGFSTVHLNTNDPSYALPLPIVRDLQSAGTIKGIYKYFLSTTGNGTPVTTAKRMGAEMGKELKDAGVDGVLLVAT